MISSKRQEAAMKNIATVALMLSLGAASIYAQENSVNMTLSGTAAKSTINLQPDAPTSEYHLDGDGTLGPFTFRTVSTGPASPQQSSTCSGSNMIYFSAVAGAGVLRFQDGGLLKVNLTGGGDCIDLAAGHATCIRVFQITGGTGRFLNASGAVTLTMTVVPVLADASSNPVFFAVTGEFTGTVSGMAADSPAARR
jgi:hypothetical protein